MSEYREVVKGSLGTFLKFILNSEKNKEQNYNYYYRGEPKHYDMRTPSLYLNRELTLNGSEKYYRTIFNELGIDDYQDNTTLVRKLAELQHYGAKTRFLDITKNPLVALYFAVEKDDKDAGYVYFFKEKEENEKYDTGHTVAIKSAISLMPREVVDKFLKIIPMIWKEIIDDDFYNDNYDSIRYGENYQFHYNQDDLLEKITNILLEVKPDRNQVIIGGQEDAIDIDELFKDDFSKNMFWNEYYHDDTKIKILNDRICSLVIDFMEFLNQRTKTKEKLEHPFAIHDDLITSHIVLHSKNTARIKQQQGAFIYPCITNKTEYLDIQKAIHNSIQEKVALLSTNKKDEKDIERIKIPAHYKSEIKKQLALIGITDGFIYPDIEHISKSLL